MAPSSEGGVFIPTQDIYEQLVALRADVHTLIALQNSNKDHLSDLETRMRVVEKWRYGIAAVAAFVAVIVSALGNLWPGK